MVASVWHIPVHSLFSAGHVHLSRAVNRPTFSHRSQKWTTLKMQAKNILHKVCYLYTSTYDVIYQKACVFNIQTDSVKRKTNSCNSLARRCFVTACRNLPEGAMPFNYVQTYTIQTSQTSIFYSSTNNAYVCVLRACVRVYDAISDTGPVGIFLARTLNRNDKRYGRHRGTHRESKLTAFLFQWVKRAAMLIMKHIHCPSTNARMHISRLHALGCARFISGTVPPKSNQ
jgi:hypothetical protein